MARGRLRNRIIAWSFFPTSIILSGLLLLRHVGLLKQAAAIENALLAALEAGNAPTIFEVARPDTTFAAGCPSRAESISPSTRTNPGRITRFAA